MHWEKTEHYPVPVEYADYYGEVGEDSEDGEVDE